MTPFWTNGENMLGETELWNKILISAYFTIFMNIWKWNFINELLNALRKRHQKLIVMLVLFVDYIYICIYFFIIYNYIIIICRL